MHGTRRKLANQMFLDTGFRWSDEDVYKWATGQTRPLLGNRYDLNEQERAPPLVIVSEWLGIPCSWWWDFTEDVEDIEPGETTEDPWSPPLPDWTDKLWNE
jgi:hypothetical protein